MSMIFELLNSASINSVFLFVVALVLLFISAYIGKYFFKKRHGNNVLVDDETNIVLGAILSLLALLIGFVLSISIQGYNERQKTEENEAISIGVAAQYTQLLTPEQQQTTKTLLVEYLDARVVFFKSGMSQENQYWQAISFQKQAELWDFMTTEVAPKEHASINVILSAFSNLYVSQQNTLASWKHHVPNAAWFLLIVFAICANILIGYNIRGLKGKNWLIFLLPLLTTLALFIIAEIDTPGEGVIHVVPDNLLLLKQNMF
ncbi:hypothetical protein RHO15_08340 [Utexia brackfieldae]|uniref:bestrophin-like domain n=1 Tax=Utexia brackfieldae TaxID=3074108 RepID=UPI00370D49B8